MRYALSLLIAVGGLLVSPHARAATTCTATMTDLSFGTVVPGGAAVNATATLNYSCTYSGLLSSLFGDYIRLCFSIGTGSTGSGYNPRTMTSDAGDTMAFQIYSDSGSTVWGGTGSAYTVPQATVQFTVLSNGAAQGGSLTVYGQVPMGQAALGAGAYMSSFNSATNAQLTYAYNEVLLSIGTYPSTCTNGGTGNSTGLFPFSVKASVQPACHLTTASNMNFPTVASNFSSNNNASSTFQMTCVSRTAWQVGLDNGQHASGTIRRMVQGANAITYQLYSDNAFSTPWGSTLNTDTVSGTGNGSSQTLKVYGQVAPQSGLVAGSYSDTITVMVTF